MNDTRSSGSPIARLTLVALASCTAFVLRALPWRNFLGDRGELLFYGPDSYDHLRRITLGMADFPRVPTFDSFYGYPVGTGQIWSPLFDYLLSLLSLLVAGGHPSQATAELIGFWLSPCLAAVTIFMVYRAGSLIFSRRAGIVAAFVLALMPGHILYSFVSELDHHVAEPIICLGLMISFLQGTDPQRSMHRPFAAVVSAGWLLFAILIWRGSLIFWGVAFAGLFLQVTADLLHGDSCHHKAKFGWQTAAAGTIMLLPVCIFNVWGTSSGISFGIVSWFHVLFLAACALILAVLDRYPPDRRMLAAFAGTLMFIAAALLLLPTTRRFASEFLSGLAVIGGKDPWLDSISELRPMLYPNGKLDLWYPTETLSIIYWLFPALLWAVYDCWQKEQRNPQRFMLFMVWGGIFWLLPLFRERYVLLTAVTLALGSGLLADILAKRVVVSKKQNTALTVAAGLLLMLPTTAFLKNIPTMGLIERERHDLPLTLAWLRENTPVPAGFMNPKETPDYGVMSDWGIGAYIDYLGQRPTVATNFGWETHGLFESAAFMTSTDPEVASRLLKTNRVRYLLLGGATGNIMTLRAIAKHGVRTGKLDSSFLSPFVPLASHLYRLYFQDGAAFHVENVNEPALGSYRLIYESPGNFSDPVAGDVSHYKIFEVVTGALIKGQAAPGERVELSLQLDSPRGRRLNYRDWNVADAGGVFTFRVPYATGIHNGTFSPVTDYQVITLHSVLSFRVNESDLLTGREVTHI